MELRELLAVDSFEPNNSFATAKDIGAIQSATIDPAGDVDYFKWTSPGNGVVRFDALFSHAQGDIDMRLFDAQFNEIDASTSLNDNERVRASVTTGQVVYINLDEFSGSLTVPYTLTTEFIRPDSIDLSTPNNTLASAFDLSTGDRILSNLNIHSSTDKDYFRWTATVDGNLTVETKFLHANGDLSLSILTPAGFEVASSRSQSNDEIVTFNVTAGTSYIIEVTEARGNEHPKYDLIVDFNAPPTMSRIDTVLGPIGGTTLVNFTVNDADTPLSSLRLTGTSNNQFLLPNSNISFSGSGRDRTVALNSPGGFGFVTVTLTLSDQSGGVASQSFDVGFFLDNASPVISNIGDISIAENSSSGIIPFTVSDAQTPANQLTVTAGSSNTLLVPNQNIVLGGSGTNRTVRVTPLPNRTGTAFITLTVTDTDSASSQETFVVSVFDATTLPTISPIADVTIDEDTSTGPIGFTVADSDTPLSSLLISASTSDPSVIPSSGILLTGSGANRTVTVTPAANASGTALVSLTVSDGSASSTETFNVTVQPINDKPTISAIADRTILEDTSLPAVPFTVGDTETSAANLTVTANSSNQFMVPLSSIVIGGSGANRTVSVTPVPSRQGSSLITLTVSDGNGGTADSAFVLTVLGDDDSPVISPIPDETILNGISTNVAFTVRDDSLPSDQLFVNAFSSDQTIIDDDDLLILGVGENRNVSITPLREGGPVTITVLASDGINNTTQQFNVVVLPSGPAISPISNRVINEDTSTGPIAFTISDPNTPASLLSVSASSNNQSLIPNSFIQLGGSGSTRTVTVTPAANASGGPATISLTLTNGTSSFTETFDVTVTPVDDPPIISNIQDQVIPGGSNSGPLSFTIGDIDTALSGLTVTATSNNQALVPNSNLVLTGIGANRAITVTPAPNASGGPAIITVTVDDGTTAVNETFNVTVVAANNVPSISPIDDQVVPEDTGTGPIAFTLADADTPATSLTVTAVSNSQSLVPNNNIVIGGTGANRTVTVIPATNANGGPVAITLTVTDGVNSSSETFNLTVTPVNDTPTISKVPDRTIPEGSSTGPLVFSVSDVDTPLAVLTVTASSSNQTLIPNGNIVIAGSGANRTVTVTPAANANGGPTTITLTVSDGTTSSSSTFNVTVQSVDGPPSISAIADEFIDENTSTGPLPFTVADADTPLNSLTITASSDNQALVPDNRIVIGGSGANRTISVTPNNNINGSANITVNVSDGTTTVSETFVLTVIPRMVGDVNGDGKFDSSDLVLVFQAGEYEDGIDGNSTFEEGDWNGDGDFTSTDLVIAFQAGTYEQGAVAAPFAAAVPADTGSSSSPARLAPNLVDLALAAEDLDERKGLK